MHYKEMRELIETGTCPNCKGPMSNRTQVRHLVTNGDCDVCNIVWCSTTMTIPNKIEAAPKWNLQT